MLNVVHLQCESTKLYHLNVVCPLLFVVLCRKPWSVPYYYYISKLFSNFQQLLQLKKYGGHDAEAGIDINSFINDNNCMYEIRHYLTEDDKDVYLEWLKIQRDTVAKIAIVKRINRVELGNFGDHEFCRDGVCELRIDVGAGYRVYYAVSGKDIVLLLCGGNKRTQTADINRACEYWSDWKKENGK